MMTRIIPIATVLILGCFNVPRTLAQWVQSASTTCLFNQAEEACLITVLDDDTYRVTWLSNGKVVDYSFFDCRPVQSEGMNIGGDICQVRILEDNGQISMGTAQLGGRGPWIESNNGNSTALPFIPYLQYGN